jgi:hypothetical protein
MSLRLHDQTTASAKPGRPRLIDRSNNLLTEGGAPEIGPAEMPCGGEQGVLATWREDPPLGLVAFVQDPLSRPKPCLI